MMAVFAMVVFRGQGTVAQSSGIFLAGLLPLLLFSPAAGWLCDRFDRKWLMIGSELLSGLVISGLIFTTRLEWVYILLALQAITTSIMMPARQAAVPDLVSREDLTRANALLQQLNGIIKMLAPVLAGMLLAVMTPHQAIILDVISFGLSALILTRLPSLPPHPEAQPAGTQVSGAAADTAVANPTADNAATRARVMPVLIQSLRLRLLMIVAFVAVTLFVGFDILAPVFTRDVLQAKEGFFGLLVGLIGVGTLLATVVLMARKGQHDPWRDIVASLLLLGAIPLSMAIASRLGNPAAGRVLALAGCLVGGIGNGLVLVQASTLIQILSPAALLGRMGGVFQTVLVGGQLFGILVTPLLIPALLSMGLYFSFASVAVVLLTIYLVIALRRSQPGAPAVEFADAGLGD